MTSDKIRIKCVNIIRDQFKQHSRTDFEEFRRVFNKWFEKSLKNGRLHSAILTTFDNDMTMAAREKQKKDETN